MLNTENEILARLKESDRDWVFSRGTLEGAPVKRMFVQPDKPLTDIYFIEAGLASMVIRMSDNSTVEVGAIGREGLVGLQVFLGADFGGVEVFQQVSGAVRVLPVHDFRELLERSSELRAAMSDFTLGLIRQMTMAVACNRLHPVDQRLARWLLMVRDRVQSDEFDLKQEFLAEMLGVRRPGVSIAASMLRRSGLIRYSRGRIRIIDPERLEAAACECYGALRRNKKSA